MTAKLFSPGKNIAMKVPSHEYKNTIYFYKNVLGLKMINKSSPDDFESVAFEFGDKQLWIDNIAGISQAELWLEIETDDVSAAQHYLTQQGCSIRNEIEPLPKNVNGFWLSGPNNIIHLVTQPDDKRL